MVDLSLGQEGLLTFRNGEKGYTFWLPCDDEKGKAAGNFDIRYEHGWYVEYTRNGLTVSGGFVHHLDGTITELPPDHERDIVEVVYCDFEKGMPYGFHP